MRFLTALLLTSSLVLSACSSDEAAPADTGPNKCVVAGGECALNFPFVCRPGKVASTGDLAKACGVEPSSGKEMPCCFPVVDTDTGVDVGVDSSTDSAADAPTDAPADGSGDAPKDAPAADASGDAVGDATDGG